MSWLASIIETRLAASRSGYAGWLDTRARCGKSPSILAEVERSKA
jgi:hypothetical protein